MGVAWIRIRGIMVSMSDVNGETGPSGSVSADQGSPAPEAWRQGGPPASKRLERKFAGRWVAGVCAGLAAYTGVDATVIRLIFAVLTFFGGVGAIAYVIAWALMPEEGDTASIAERFISKTGS
jgi:phage shock protein PspC (stress-responsive transcriptional regulator)